jgi:hypothetical protein
MPEKLSGEELERLTNFVFKGTVLKLKAATMDVVPVTDNTAIVRVDEILEAPDAMTDFAGREITVEIGGGKRPKKGERVVFYANGWIFGEGLAVRSLDHRPALAGLEAVGVTPGNPVENLANKKARIRFEQSQAVVTGRVTSVRLPPSEAAAFMASTPILVGAESVADAAPVEPEFKPVSEHDPIIHEAVVEVDAVHKGQTSSNEVTIRFPNSTDVQWYKAPKFRPGQQGFFMLHKEDTKESVPAGAASGAAMVAAAMTADEVEDAYTALHQADFQPLDQPGGVRNLISNFPEPVIKREE